MTATYGDYFEIIRLNAVIRQKPESDSDVLLRVRPGSYLPLIDSKQVNGYYHVEIPATGDSGWIYSNLGRRQAPKKFNISGDIPSSIENNSTLIWEGHIPYGYYNNIEGLNGDALVCS